MFAFVGCIVGGLLVVKLVHCYKERRRNRLTKKALKKLPTRKYKKGDHYDTCAICLEDYEEGEKLRVLPCDHTYHCKCVDPWLTNRKKSCPQCKRCVIPKELRDSDYSSTDEEGEGSGENTPLLRNNNVPAGQSSTNRSGSMGQTEPSVFERSGLPASIEPEVVVIRSGFRCQISSSEEDGAQSDNEEMQGAVGGVGISDKQEEKAEAGDDVVLREVDETGEPTGTSVTSETAGLLKSKRKSRATRNLQSSVRAEGSINATFNSSTSSEDDGASSAKKSKKKKRKNNVV